MAAISALTFAPGSTPPRPGLAPWDSFTDTALTAGIVAFSANVAAVESSVGVAASEVTRTDLPDQVPAAAKVIRADAAFAGVMGEIATGGAGVERLDRVGRQRPETHRRHVQQRDVVRLGAVGTAQPDARSQVVGESRPQRMAQELVADRVHVALGAERFVALGALGAFVHQVAGLAVERRCLGVGLDEVLPDLGTDQLHQETDMPEDRVQAQDRVPRLQQVPRPQCRQRQHDHTAAQPTIRCGSPPASWQRPAPTLPPTMRGRISTA